MIVTVGGFAWSTRSAPAFFVRRVAPVEKEKSPSNGEELEKSPSNGEESIQWDSRA